MHPVPRVVTQHKGMFLDDVLFHLGSGAATDSPHDSTVLPHSGHSAPSSGEEDSMESAPPQPSPAAGAARPSVSLPDHTL